MGRYETEVLASKPSHGAHLPAGLTSFDCGVEPFLRPIPRQNPVAPNGALLQSHEETGSYCNPSGKYRMKKPALNETSQRIAYEGSGRIGTLDAIRFVAALWVSLSHGALPLRDFTSNTIVRAFFGSFDGVSAVIVFFIVSGFCIHIPYVSGRPLPIVKFMLRRYIRIVIPLVVCLTIMNYLGGSASERGHAVLWSVYAEIVYYTLYPALRKLSARFGWNLLIAVSFFISCILVIARINELWVWEFGWLTWLWGLPIWLSGCALAERFSRCDLVKAFGNIWLWRLGVWLYGAAAIFAVFHLPVKVGYPVSMLPFGIFAFFWLSMELQSSTPAWPILERFGSAGYSLYLIHSIVLGEIFDYVRPLNLGIAMVAIPLPAIAASTYVFYKCVEAPSHNLARWIANSALGLVRISQ